MLECAVQKNPVTEHACVNCSHVENWNEYIL